MKIEELMSSPAVVIDTNKSIVEAATMMKEHNIGFLPIVKDNFMVGVVTDRDIVIRAVRDSDITMPISQVMTPNPMTVVAGTDVVIVAKLMANEKIRRTVVTKDGVPLGVVTSKDLLKAQNTLSYVLATYNVDNTSPYYKIYNNGNPHNSVKVDDYRL